MKISSLRYSFMDSLRSLKRNRTLTTASIATVAATLFILGVFLVLMLDVSKVVDSIGSKVEVKIILKDNIDINDDKDLVKKIKDVDGVTDVIFESKDRALRNMKEQLGEENKDLLEGLEKQNPLPNSYIVRVEKPEIISAVVNEVKNMNGIDSIKDGRDIVDKIMKISNTLRIIGVILFVILISVSLFLIINTIKIAVFSRKREIGIMKYIGATDWYIRWPFIIEGIIIGIIGALIAGILLFYAYNALYNKVGTDTLLLQIIKPSYVLTHIIWEFVLSGILIGSAGSIIAIRKFLAV